MKSGLIKNTFILAAFQKFSGHPKSLVELFTWDKEIGSPASKDTIMAEAKNARLVFNSEPGRSHGNIIIGRKGGIFCNCEIVCVAAHSGYFLNRGAALYKMVRKVQALHALTSLDRRNTINV